MFDLELLFLSQCFEWAYKRLPDGWSRITLPCNAGVDSDIQSMGEPESLLIHFLSSLVQSGQRLYPDDGARFKDQLGDLVPLTTDKPGYRTQDIRAQVGENGLEQLVDSDSRQPRRSCPSGVARVCQIGHGV